MTPQQKWARDLTDEELIEEFKRISDECDEWEAADDEDKAHGGAPGEGMYERYNECEGELKKRGIRV